ncbi:MAG: hypothetical protein JXD21_05405 [Candidatus Omnitrophica bacterium]|nr:hypothetical protein [Candidatus Omnitrophota bacterium]
MKMKVIILGLLLAGMCLIALSGRPETGSSASFKVSLTIPQIVGVNVAAPADKQEGPVAESKNTGIQKQTEIVSRKDQTVLLETVVAK